MYYSKRWLILTRW